MPPHQPLAPVHFVLWQRQNHLQSSNICTHLRAQFCLGPKAQRVWRASPTEQAMQPGGGKLFADPVSLPCTAGQLDKPEDQTSLRGTLNGPVKQLIPGKYPDRLGAGCLHYVEQSESFGAVWTTRITCFVSLAHSQLNRLWFCSNMTYYNLQQLDQHVHLVNLSSLTRLCHMTWLFTRSCRKDPRLISYQNCSRSLRAIMALRPQVHFDVRYYETVMLSQA